MAKTTKKTTKPAANLVPKRRDLMAKEQGQLAAKISGAGYKAILETLASMAAADADGANEMFSLDDEARMECAALADQLVAIE